MVFSGCNFPEDLVNSRLDGRCNHLFQTEWGAAGAPFGGTLDHDRLYDCEFDGTTQQWGCFYEYPGGARADLPLERDVERFIHANEPSHIFTQSVGQAIPVSSTFNQLLVGLGVFVAHDLTDSKIGTRPNEFNLTGCPLGNCGDYLTPHDRRIYVRDIHTDDTVISNCTTADLACSDPYLFEPSDPGKGTRKIYNACERPEVVGQRFVPWMSKTQFALDPENDDEVINAATSYLDLSAIYSVEPERQEALEADDYATTGKFKMGSYNSDDFGPHPDSILPYCFLPQFAFVDSNTVISNTTYASKKACRDDLGASPGDRKCYVAETLNACSAVLKVEIWRWIDVSTAADFCSLSPLACTNPTAEMVTIITGNRCSGDCVPADEVRAECDALAASLGLPKSLYIVSWTPGLVMDPPVQLDNFLPTALDTGLLFDFIPQLPFSNPHITTVNGDVRAHENVLLNAFHLLFVREHNRIAQEILDKACTSQAEAWMHDCEDYQNDDETAFDGHLVFTHARKMNIGRYQHIIKTVFEELLDTNFGYNKWFGYHPWINPSNTQEAAIALRGHTLLPHDVFAVDSCGDPLAQYPRSGVAFGNTNEYLNLFQWFAAQSEDNLFLGMMKNPMGEADHLVDRIIRANLPGRTGRTGVDIPSNSINRGREHDLAPFTDLYDAYFGGDFVADKCAGDDTSLDCFKEISGGDTDLATDLKNLYGSVTLVDVWTGYHTEAKGPGNVYGELQRKVLRKFFHDLIHGDRFWYENAWTHSHKERVEHKRMDLRDLIIEHSNDPTMMDEVLPQNAIHIIPETNFRDSSECVNDGFVSYMPPPGVVKS